MLTGEVVEKTGEPIIGAKVVLRGSGAGELLVTASDLNGRFSLLQPSFEPPVSIQVTLESYYYGAALNDLPCSNEESLHLRASLSPSREFLGFVDPAPILDWRSTSSGATIESDERTGEPSVHPH